MTTQAPEKTETLRTLALELYDACGDIDEATDRLLQELTLDEIRIRARPAIRREVSVIVRRRERASGIGEKYVRVFGSDQNGGGGNRVKPATTRADEIIGMLDRSFQLSTGERVTREDATIAQHQDRAALLRKFAGDVERKASVHERACEMIAEAGVTCLRDLMVGGGE